MISIRSMRSYLDANGLYLMSYHSLQVAWSRLNSVLLARAFSVRKLTVVPPFHLKGRRFVRMGENFAAGPGLWLEAVYRYNQQLFEPQIILGDNVSLSNGVHIAATTFVQIGSDVLVGSGVLITDHNHGSYSGESPSSPDEPPARRLLEAGRRTVIGDRVWIGDGVVVTAGSCIGDGAIVGANSVVVGTVQAGAIVAGAPARVIKVFDPVSGQWKREDS